MMDVGPVGQFDLDATVDCLGIDVVSLEHRDLDPAANAMGLYLAPNTTEFDASRGRRDVCVSTTRNKDSAAVGSDPAISASVVDRDLAR